MKVASLQDMSCQLLVHAEGKDCLEAKEKVHVIGNRLKLLLKEVTRHIKDLEKILDVSSSQLVTIFTTCHSSRATFLINLTFFFQSVNCASGLSFVAWECYAHLCGTVVMDSPCILSGNFPISGTVR